jgi:GST-like protein
MIALLHWEPNTVFLKPLIALHEKGCRFESRWFDALALEQHAADFPASTESLLTLEREGPVLLDGDAVVSSSFFMLEFIAERVQGPELKPGDAWAHYQAQAWGQRIALLVAPVVSALGCARHLVPWLATQDQSAWKKRIEAIEPLERRERWAALLDGRTSEAAVAPLRANLRDPLEKIESALGASEWLAGDAYSIADIDAYAMLKPLPQLVPELVNEQATPRIAEFLERIAQRPAVRAALATARTGNPGSCFLPGAEPSRWG